ncbi:hypothetical protein GN956_G5181 [Arapaima gigas]
METGPPQRQGDFGDGAAMEAEPLRRRGHSGDGAATEGVDLVSEVQTSAPENTETRRSLSSSLGGRGGPQKHSVRHEKTVNQLHCRR